MTTTQTTRPPPKALLYCPDCWHAALPTGDWLVQSSPVGEAVVCPDCGTVVTVRRAGPVPA
ncbi:hypothetical protein [Halobaculum marinum]|uniref:DUF8106 domain-containing protein n=1 Tax=Halobaculum marinum TaxID=3031996 RepID=A0ABD5WU77_9EURY|nr:hypothetical protein [Halobaculum sp. DT55]